MTTADDTIAKKVQVECVRCREVVTLPPTPGRPGFVNMQVLTGWTALPWRCPNCSRDVVGSLEGGSVEIGDA